MPVRSTEAPIDDPWPARRQRTVRRRRLLVALAAALGAGSGAVAPSASAHPFGPPLEARLTAEGTTVRIAWTGAEDDWVALGEHTGAFDAPGRGLTGQDALTHSREVREYLAEHVDVSTGAGRCRQELEPLRDPLGRGARFAFHCPPGTTAVTVRIDVLTDADAAYRTVLSGPDDGSGRRLLTAVDPSTQVALTPARTGGGGGGLLAVGAGGAVLLASATALVAHRQRARAGTTAPTGDVADEVVAP